MGFCQMMGLWRGLMLKRGYATQPLAAQIAFTLTWKNGYKLNGGTGKFG